MTKRPATPDDLASILDGQPLWVLLVARDETFAPERLSESLRAQCVSAVQRLDDVDPTEIRQALEEILLLPDPGPALQWLCDIGALEKLLPELHATVALSQEAGRRHKDVWAHTKQVVAQAPPRPLLRWAALLHDIGKVETRTFTPDGKVQFLGHAEKGARMFRRIAKRLFFPKPVASKIHFLILKHLRANQYEGQWTDAAVRRFYKDVGEHLDDLLDLSRADITTARPAKKAKALRQLDELAQRIEQLKQQDAKVPPLPSGLGNALMEHFELQPGPKIGVIRRHLEEQVESGTLDAEREAAYYIEYLESCRDRLGL